MKKEKRDCKIWAIRIETKSKTVFVFLQTITVREKFRKNILCRCFHRYYEKKERLLPIQTTILKFYFDSVSFSFSSAKIIRSNINRN